MTLSSSITNAVVVMVVVLIVVGTILGLALAGNDLLNPHRSAAEQRLMDVETAHKANVNQLEERKIAAENELKIEYARRKQEQSLTLLQVRNYGLTLAAALALVILALGGAVFLARIGNIALGRARPATPLVAGQGEEMWQSLAYRQARIEAARTNERYFREAFANVFSPPQVEREQHVPATQEKRREAVPSGADNARPRQEYFPAATWGVG
jgi:hypothetical protein